MTKKEISVDKSCKYIIANAKFNWADEFDMAGFIISKKKDWEKDLEVIKAYLKGKQGKHNEIYFGTNESINFKDYNQFIDNVNVKEITADEALLFSSCLHKHHENDVEFYYGLAGKIVSDLIDRAHGGE